MLEFLLSVVLCGIGNNLQLLSAAHSTPHLTQAAAGTVPRQNLTDVNYKNKREMGIVIPLVYDPPLIPLPLVRVSVNGTPPLLFLLDTGFSGTVLVDAVAARKLKLHPDAGTTIVEPGHQVLHKVVLQRIALCGADRQQTLMSPNVGAFIMDLQVFHNAFPRSPIAGIIGTALLNSPAVRLNFVAKEMTLFAEPPALPAGSNTTSLAMDTRDAQHYVTASFAPDASAELLIDTGSPSTNVPLSLVRQLHAEGVMYILWLSAEGTLHIADQMLIPRLSIGDFVEPHVVVGAVPVADAPRVGLDILGRYQVTLDFRNGRLTLERPPGYLARPVVPGWTGMELVGRNGKFYADDVEAASAASRAGIRQGDHIIVVDGNLLESLPVSVAQRLLDGAAGNDAKLRLERAKGKSFLLRCRRRSAFETPQHRSLGLTMEKANGQPLKILGVAAASAAEKAGLRAGDKVVTWNGLATETLTSERFRRALRTSMRTSLLSIGIFREGTDRQLLFHVTVGNQSPPKD